jgi:hypothetical protein
MTKSIAAFVEINAVQVKSATMANVSSLAPLDKICAIINA